MLGSDMFYIIGKIAKQNTLFYYIPKNKITSYQNYIKHFNKFILLYRKELLK